jgi:hypothetical protein
MKLGFFYQAGHMDNNILSTYVALKQLRSVYPDNPVAFYEDESDNLKDIASQFNCIYDKIPKSENILGKRMPVVDLKTGLQWLERIYTSCNTTLKDVEWVMHFEDDVWLQKPIENYPSLDFAGSIGHGYHEELYEYLKMRFNVTDESRSYVSPLGQLRAYGMCGGSVFKRSAFLDSYNKINEIDWDYLTTLDFRICKYTDAILSFIMNHAGYRYEVWSEWSQYNEGVITDCSVLHNVKYFYDYKSIDDLKIVVEKNEVKEFLKKYNGLL